MDKFLLIEEKDLEKTKKLIKKLTIPIYILAQNDDYNRKILEFGGFEAIVSIERGSRKSRLKVTDSGLNEVLAKIAFKNKIKMAIDLEEIRNLEKKEKFERLKKIMFNIRLCRKKNVQIILLNYKNERDATAFLLSLGSSSAQLKRAISF